VRAPQDECGWRRALESAARELQNDGVPVPALEGKLLRPALAWSLLPEERRGAGDSGFAMGALAIQMVHEASLLHDDILDEAVTRRGRASLAADRGTGAALVLGDQYLTAAYRAACRSGNDRFLHLFIEAVERTVAGEAAQARHAGRMLDDPAYRELIRGKSGELFGAAAALAALWRELSAADIREARELGRDVGALYQMVDDFLDYCPRSDTGKAPFQDYRQRKYTFVLGEGGIEGFDAPPEQVATRLFAGGGSSPMYRALDRLRSTRTDLVDRARRLFGGAEEISRLLDGWVREAHRALELHEPDARLSLQGLSTDPTPFVARQARAVGGPEAWGEYFGRHSKSFQFAARLFPPAPRADVEGVYAFCRFTDDLVDEAGVPPEEARRRLEAWRELVRSAYEGEKTGVPLADRVMARLAGSAAPFHYVDDLLNGVAMDLEPVRYDTLEDLETYTYRVASVVGGWITELFGLHDPHLLQRAYALGHAMQLTNILRDVGEDLRRGRLYLPLARMEAYGVDPDALQALAERGQVPQGYPELMEELMEVADHHYENAFEAIPCLPVYYRRPVAVAARVYQGIHDEIRRNGYDNGSRRAYTSFLRKLRLGLTGLRDLRRQQRADAVEGEALIGLLAAGDGTPGSTY
jgi:phytoene synthase